MKRNIIISLILCLLTVQTTTAQMAGKYTNSQPLVIVCENDFAPYMFSDENGEATGYNVEVLSNLLSMMHIPHRFAAKPAAICRSMFEHKDADLIIDRYSRYTEEPYCYSRSSLGYYKVSADTLDGIVRTIAGEIHLAGYEQEFMNQLDDQYARLEQNGTMEVLHDKWFHPERSHNDAPIIAVYVTLFLLLVTFALLFVNRLIKRRAKAATNKASEAAFIMRQALSMGKYSIVLYDIKADRIMNRHGHLVPDEGITHEQFASRLHPEDKVRIVEDLKRLKDGEIDMYDINGRWNIGTEEKPIWMYAHGHSFLEKDQEGNPRYLVNTLQDVTAEKMQEDEDKELAKRFAKLFDSTLTAMSFYDKTGMLIELNRNMHKLCEFDDLGEKYFRQTNIFDVPVFKNDLIPNRREGLHVCQHMSYPEQGIDKYIECRVRPAYENDELLYYIVTAHDVTDERNMYLEQKRQEKAIHEANEQTSRYERELNYLLKNSNMWIWKSSLADKTISFSRSLRNSDFKLTFEQFRLLYEAKDLPKAMKALGNMEGIDTTINAVLRIKNTPISLEPAWFSISGIPLHDANGQLLGHFGIVRDVNALIEAQEQLKRERKRAEESGKLKSAFLANMTHEIRTPLNAIVGFSDLLPMIDGQEERREFIRIIRNNCDMLIRLIDDIIEASNMNHAPLKIEPTDIDFAVAFNDICQTLSQRVQEVPFIIDNPYTSFKTHIDKGRLQQVITNFTTNAVKYTHQGHIKVGYSYLSFNELKEKVKDPQLEGQSMPFSGIYMYCEDTGAGIPKDKQEAVFERFVKLNDFVQGTGLGLSICKSIADRCAGRIGVTSDGEGCGSTFWIWIPCKRIEN